MSKPLDDDMMKATRLTTSGRLLEATELLQRMLRGQRSASESKSPVAAPKTSPLLAVGQHAPRLITTLIDKLKLKADDQKADQKIELSARARAAPTPEIMPPEGQFIAKSYGNAAGIINYKLYIPSKVSGSPKPLIIMLHGCGQSPDDFAVGTGMNFAAEEKSCFVAYPEQTARANSQRCWNWFQKGHQARDLGEPSLIAGIATQICSQYNVDLRRIYIAGLSAGGAAAAVLTDAYPDIFAALGVHSGVACGLATDMTSAFSVMQGRSGAEPQRAAKHVPAIVFHGDRDSTVHPKNGDQVVTRAASSGRFQRKVQQGTTATGRAFTRTVHLDAKGNAHVEDWVIHGGGHAWFGGSAKGSYTDPQGPDASREMLRFFLSHKRRT